MINREIPFRPRLEGEFRVRFYNAASEITEKTPTLTIARIAEREIEWVEKDCQYNIEQRKKYRAVWFLFRDLIRASWKACYRNGVIYMSLPTLNGTDMHDTTSPEVKALLRSWMSESRHERLVGYTDFINRMENPGTNKQSIAALIADPRASRDGSPALGLHGSSHPFHPPRRPKRRSAGARHSQESHRGDDCT